MHDVLGLVLVLLCRRSPYAMLVICIALLIMWVSLHCIGSTNEIHAAMHAVKDCSPERQIHFAVTGVIHSTGSTQRQSTFSMKYQTTAIAAWTYTSVFGTKPSVNTACSICVLEHVCLVASIFQHGSMHC